MAGWFRSKDRIAALEAELIGLRADLATLRGERAQTDLAADLQREQARAVAAVGEIADRLLGLQERVQAHDRRAEAVEDLVEALGRRLDDVSHAAPSPPVGGDVGALEEKLLAQADEIGALRSSIQSVERASRLFRADIERTLSLVAAQLLKEESGAHMAGLLSRS